MSSLQDLPDRLKRHAFYLLAVASVPALVVLAVNLLTPREYLSKTSILPANSRFSDRARFGGAEVKELYSAFGSGDDLDRLYATARSHPVMMNIVDSFGLVRHYRLEKRREGAREAALRKFRRNCSILKTEYGEIHIKVWDRDRQLAADLANAMVARTEKVHQDIYREYFASSLQKMESSFEGVGAKPDGKVGTVVDTQLLRNYHRSLTDYQMALLNPPPALMVLERAIPSVKHDRPRIALNVIASALVGLFTGVAAVLLLPLFIKRDT